MNENAHADWARPLSDDKAFRYEQARLGHFWTLLGITGDVEKDGDWFRATLGGRSVFVQRFGDVIRGFENRCAHRFYPLRTADKGNGPVVCGFHHWRYDREGRAVGVPMCPQLFGVAPHQLDATLKAVDIATCGSLIFGRFPQAGNRASLEDYLGESYPILAAMCAMPASPNRLHRVIEANWKLSAHISLDDYHIVAIHPSTFGRGGYLATKDTRYFRFGLHSALFMGSADTLSSMAEDCHNNRYRLPEYRIFNIFPNLVIPLFYIAPYWYAFVHQFVPEAPGRSNLRGWFYRTPFLDDEGSALNRLVRPLSDWVYDRIVSFYIKRVTDEDVTVCERQQTVAHQIDGWPILGALEERIRWFEESYTLAMSGCDGARDSTSCHE